MSSTRLVLCAVSVALATACSSAGDTQGNGTGTGGTASAGTAGASSANAASSKPPAFEDFPGDGVVFIESGMRVGVRLKAIDSTWAAEALGKSAQQGYHYLAVWIAVTPELPDRGAQNVRTNTVFHVRHKPAGGKCGATTQANASGYCYTEGMVGSQLDVLSDDRWRDHRWESAEYVQSEVKRGETRIGQVGFQIDDTLQTGEFALCAPSSKEPFYPEKFPCTPVKAPDGSR